MDVMPKGTKELEAEVARLWDVIDVAKEELAARKIIGPKERTAWWAVVCGLVCIIFVLLAVNVS